MLNNPVLENLFNEICIILKENPILVKKRDRGDYKVICRRIFCYIAKNLTDYSLTEIARIFFSEHSMVIHNEKRARELLSANDSIFTVAWETVIEHSDTYKKIISHNEEQGFTDKKFYTTSDLIKCFNAGYLNKDKKLFFRNNFGLDVAKLEVVRS